MAAQEHVALARSLLDLYNNRQSDPAWLDKSVAAFAADCEFVSAPSGTTFHGPEGYKRFLRFLLVESFPDLRTELTNVFATEDQVVLEGMFRGTKMGSRTLPTRALPVTGRPGEPRCCFVLQIRRGKITSLHAYYDLTTVLEQLGLNSAAAPSTPGLPLLRCRCESRNARYVCRCSSNKPSFGQ
jgi:ketosteroid isomerase-like protein